jgi:transketolase
MGFEKERPAKIGRYVTAATALVPNLIISRRGDTNETARAGRIALEMRDQPVAAVDAAGHAHTRSRAVRRRRLAARRVRPGRCAERKARLFIGPYSHGSEVTRIVALGQKLLAHNITVLLVSLPS